MQSVIGARRSVQSKPARAFPRLLNLPRPRYRIGANFLSIVRTGPTETMEAFLILVSTSYGFWFLAFSDALTFPAYRRLNFAPWAGTAWGTTLICLCALELYAIDQRHEGLRRNLPYAICLLWAWIALLMHQRGVHDPPFISAAWRAIGAAWVIWRRR